MTWLVQFRWNGSVFMPLKHARAIDSPGCVSWSYRSWNLEVTDSKDVGSLFFLSCVSLHPRLILDGSLALRNFYQQGISPCSVAWRGWNKCVGIGSFCWNLLDRHPFKIHQVTPFGGSKGHILRTCTNGLPKNGKLCVEGIAHMKLHWSIIFKWQIRQAFRLNNQQTVQPVWLLASSSPFKKLRMCDDLYQFDC